MAWMTAGEILGGIGLFFLALSLLTQGLKMASQSAVQQMLARFGRTPLRGVFFGMAATAVLQSSSVTIALIIGLVNASALSFAHAVWMILGSNIGTTTTGWMVSLTGVDINLKAYALPFVGIGMMMQSLLRRAAWKSLGLVLTGFGLFFIGIDTLKDSFAVFGDSMKDSLHAGDGGHLSLLGFVISGILITLVPQSSTASTVLVLTAAAAGITDFSSGAALLIGANIGTTSTALLVALSGSADARRAAMLHFGFNIGTGIVIFALLPWIVHFLQDAIAALGLGGNPLVTGLAAFHTFYSVFGCIIFWPFMPAIIRFLETRMFIGAVAQSEETAACLDKSALGVPALALSNLLRELESFKTRACTQAAALFTGQPLPDTQDTTVRQITDYAAEIAKTETPADVAHTLQNALRVGRYLSEVQRLSAPAARIYKKIQSLPPSHESHALLNAYMMECHNLLQRVASGTPMRKSTLARFSRRYNLTKEELLEDAVRSKMPIAEASALLDDLSLTRRLVEQAVKAQRWLGVATRRSLPAADSAPAQAAAASA